MDFYIGVCDLSKWPSKTSWQFSCIKLDFIATAVLISETKYKGIKAMELLRNFESMLRNFTKKFELGNDIRCPLFVCSINTRTKL